MRRVSVDIGGTFTDCFLVWDDQYVSAKALTTHQNLALGFNASLAQAYANLGLSLEQVMADVDSVRYATTLGTNALIERRGPKVGLITTAGFESSVPLSRGRGYGEGLSERLRKDLPMAQRPEAIVPIPLIVGIRERMAENGSVIMALDEDDLRAQVHRLVDRGAQAFVVSLVNSVVNPAHEMRVEEVIREEFPEHMLGSAPIILSHKVVGRKGEYVRTSSAILDAFLHKAMYLGLSSLELNLRENGHERPMQVVHNSGGMAQLNSTDALQTIHSGPVAGIAASEHLAAETDLGNIVCTDMGGTSFDIGLVVEGGIKFYDFNPVIDRWLVNIPMVHLVTLGAGGGSIAQFDRLRQTVSVGPKSAGSDPGPACYDKGGREATVTDADLLLGYLRADDYAGGRITLNTKRADSVMRRTLGEALGIDTIAAAKLVKQRVDNDMANGIATELRARGYEPSQFTMLAYGGNGALHACGIASAIGITRVLVPPFSSVFSAVGAGNMDQLHIHERSLYLQVYDSGKRALMDDFDGFNAIVAELEARGRADLLRQGFAETDIRYRLEVDLRYGNQLAQTAVVVGRNRIANSDELLELITLFGHDYGKRYGEGSQSPEAGIRINTVRVASYVTSPKLRFADILPSDGSLHDAPTPSAVHPCHFIGFDGPVETGFHVLEDLDLGAVVRGPAVVTSQSTTFLVEPGWQLSVGRYGAGWLQRIDTSSGVTP